MSAVIRCDTCNRVAETEPLLGEPGWRRVEYISDVREYNSDAADLHFCSAYCAYDYFAKKTVERT